MITQYALLPCHEKCECATPHRYLDSRRVNLGDEGVLQDLGIEHLYFCQKCTAVRRYGLDEPVELVRDDV